MDMFSALAEPTRRTIIELLSSHASMSATEIYQNFHATPPAISQHLKVLKAVDLVIVEKKAQKRMYKINPQKINELDDWVKKISKQWHASFDKLDKLLEIEKKKNFKSQAPNLK